KAEQADGGRDQRPVRRLGARRELAGAGDRPRPGRAGHGRAHRTPRRRAARTRRLGSALDPALGDHRSAYRPPTGGQSDDQRRPAGDPLADRRDRRRGRRSRHRLPGRRQVRVSAVALRVRRGREGGPPSGCGQGERWEGRQVSEAVLVLEDGTLFRGKGFGAEGETLGEAVFCTGMTGYQETLTDPGHYGQIVVATFPQIGNTGWNSADGESLGDDGTPDGRIRASGYAGRETSPTVSSWRSDRGALEDEMVRQGLVGIRGVDTRAVVRHLRGHGAVRAGIFSG